MINPPSDQFLKRLIQYYKTHSELNCLGIWRGVYNHIRSDLDSENLVGLRNTLDNLYIGDLWGLDYNQKNDWHLPPYQDCFDVCIDIMASELGIEYESYDDAVEKIEKLMGIPFDMPEYPHRPVIKVGHRNIPLRFCVCYYMAYNLNEIKPAPKSILEIGAGTGYFPFIFTKKYPDVRYNIIDLPIISVIQTYIYATMVGEDKIWFHGEEINDFDANLFIYSPDVINDIGSIDIALNHNSFPEIPEDSQAKYLQKIKTSLTEDGFFYSVNWEPENSDQTPVKIACEKNGFKNIARRVFPVEMAVHQQPSHQFYEEVYKV